MDRARGPEPAEEYRAPPEGIVAAHRPPTIAVAQLDLHGRGLARHRRYPMREPRRGYPSEAPSGAPKTNRELEILDIREVVCPKRSDVIERLAAEQKTATR